MCVCVRCYILRTATEQSAIVFSVSPAITISILRTRYFCAVCCVFAWTLIRSLCVVNCISLAAIYHLCRRRVSIKYCSTIHCIGCFEMFLFFRPFSQHIVSVATDLFWHVAHTMYWLAFTHNLLFGGGQQTSSHCALFSAHTKIG